MKIVSISPRNIETMRLYVFQEFNGKFPRYMPNVYINRSPCIMRDYSRFAHIYECNVKLFYTPEEAEQVVNIVQSMKELGYKVIFETKDRVVLNSPQSLSEIGKDCLFRSNFRKVMKQVEELKIE